MVQIKLPPPDPRRHLDPRHLTLPAGSDLFRIYDPAAPHHPGPLTFRAVGPFARFDHHEGTGADEPRAIWYGGLTLACAVVESFQSGVVDPGTKRLARVSTTRELDLLDLRGRAAMLAGTVAAISAGDHDLSQAWSRFFYGDPNGVYGRIDGLHYVSAHNGDRAVALYAVNGLEVPPSRDAPLTDPVVLAAVRRIAHDHALLVVP
jgi:hypothetical protein